MLNVALRNKINSPAIRLLYDSRLYITEPLFKNELKNYIKKVRGEYRNGNEDALVIKLKNTGNAGGWYRVKAEELTKKLYEQKGVPNEGIGSWRSIEFELVFKSKGVSEEFAKLVRFNGLGKYTTIKTDGSIKRNDNDLIGHPAEVIFSYKVGEEQTVRDFCKLLKGRAYVNNSCGTHVHFDMRSATPAQASVVGNRLGVCVPALKLLLPRNRRANQYCYQPINKIHDGSRYSFINMQSFAKYKTIEVRGHSGTINAEKILNWIKICETIMVKDAPESVSNIAELVEAYEFEPKLVEYIKLRAATFGTPQATADENESVIQEAVDIPPF